MMPLWTEMSIADNHLGGLSWAHLRHTGFDQNQADFEYL